MANLEEQSNPLNIDLTEADKQVFEKTWDVVSLIPIGLTETQESLVKRMMQIAYATGILVGLKKA